MEASAHAAAVVPSMTDELDRSAERERSGLPLLEPRPGGPAEWFAARFGPENPVRVFIVALLAGYALLVTAMVFLGLTMIYLILPIGGLGESDEDISEWLAGHRSTNQEHLSWIGSTLAGGLVIPVVIGLCLLVFLVTRHWLLAAFVLFAVAVESGSYRATSLIVERQRPDVDRLESLPVDASYPSGHTAASIALYGGLLLLIASRIQNLAVRIAALVVGIAIPVFVGWSRMYRGMHHLTDVGAGVLHGARCPRDHRLRRARRTCCHPPTGPNGMKRVAVIAHAGKSMGGGLEELRQALARAGVDDPLWSEVPKSRYAPERVEKALAEGAETIFVWGGDGMVQRCVDAMAGSDARLAILPAGTANLFASNLDIPDDIGDAVHVGLNGRERKLDLGKMNGEHFAVMAGAGLDARMIRDADGGSEGSLRPTRLHLGRIEEPSRRAVRGAHRGERRPLVRGTLRAASSSATWARSSAGSRRSRARRRRTVCSSSA